MVDDEGILVLFAEDSGSGTALAMMAVVRESDRLERKAELTSGGPRGHAAPESSGT